MAKKKNWTLADLVWVKTEDGREVAEVILKEGDSSTNPAASLKRFWGPCMVRYTKYPDGGIDAEVL